MCLQTALKIAWSCLLFAAFVLAVIAITTADWVLAPDGAVVLDPTDGAIIAPIHSIGLTQRCWVVASEIVCGSYESLDELPSDWWEASLVLLGMGTALCFLLWTTSLFMIQPEVPRKAWIILSVASGVTSLLVFISALLFGRGLGGVDYACLGASSFDRGNCDIGYSAALAFVACFLLFLAAIIVWLIPSSSTGRGRVRIITDEEAQKRRNERERGMFKFGKKQPKKRDFTMQTDLELTGWRESDEQLPMPEAATSVPTQRYGVRDSGIMGDDVPLRRHIPARRYSAERASFDLWWDGFATQDGQTRTDEHVHVSRSTLHEEAPSVASDVGSGVVVHPAVHYRRPSERRRAVPREDRLAALYAAARGGRPGHIPEQGHVMNEPIYENAKTPPVPRMTYSQKRKMRTTGERTSGAGHADKRQKARRPVRSSTQGRHVYDDPRRYRRHKQERR